MNCLQLDNIRSSICEEKLLLACEKYHVLEIQFRVNLRSLGMTAFDRSYPITVQQ